MFTTVFIVAAACVLVCVLRRNFRRAWYVLRTGDEHPDWDKLGGDYFVASWEKKRMNRSTQKNEDNVQSISE
jgi:hypothetical protein